MRLPQWLALSALLSAGIILWSLKEIIMQIFAGIVLAMALCTLTEKVRSKIPISRPIALAVSLLIILIIT